MIIAVRQNVIQHRRVDSRRCGLGGAAPGQLPFNPCPLGSKHLVGCSSQSSSPVTTPAGSSAEQPVRWVIWLAKNLVNSRARTYTQSAGRQGLASLRRWGGIQSWRMKFQGARPCASFPGQPVLQRQPAHTHLGFLRVAPTLARPFPSFSCIHSIYSVRPILRCFW